MQRQSSENMASDKSRWQRIEQIFQSALDLELHARIPFIRKACGGDRELQAELESLLAIEGGVTRDFLETPAIEMAAKSVAEDPSASLTANLAGRQLGPYRIIELLGSGGMGEVYLARDNQLDRELALKVMPARLASDPEFAARFRKEAKLASSLNHPNIVTVYAVGEAALDDRDASETVLYIAMERIHGQMLYALLHDSRLPIPRTLDIGSQIAAGLAKVHAAGIMHRDLKPQNVMISHDGVVKILDFGLGKRTPFADGDASLSSGTTSIETRSGALIGTINYMSPQQASGSRVDFRSDQFSFGAMLYEMTTGRQPFHRASYAETLAAIIKEQPEPLVSLNPDIPRALEAIIMRCLAKDPEQRFADTAELAYELAATRDNPDRELPTTFTMPHAVMERQLAVLPFSNVGNDDSVQPICDGLVETLASKLSQLEQFQEAFRVIPASEMRQESVTSARAARLTFGATIALSGSVQRSGDRLRLTINLMDTHKLRTLGSRAMDTDWNDISLMQDGVVLQVADLLGVRLGIEEQQLLSIGGTTVPEAYKHYLEAEYEHRHDKAGKNLDRALVAYQNALALDPNYALAYAGMGETYWYKYELTKDAALVPQARANCESALRLNPRLALVHVTLGILDSETGRPEQAIAALQQALKLDPCCGEAYRTLARVFETTGRIAEAEATFQRAIAMRPKSWGTHNRLGSFYFRLARYAEAEREFQKILELAPDNARAYQNLGSIYTLQQRTDEAIVAFEKSIELAPHYVLPYSNLGTLHFQQGRFTEAARVFERAMQIDDRNFRLWQNLAAAYSWIEEEKPKAAATFQRAAEIGEQELLLNPSNVRLQVHLAGCYSQLGQPERARELVEGALATNPKEVSIYFHAAVVYEEIGERQQAIRWLTEAVRRGYSRKLVESAQSLANLRKDSAFKDFFSI